MNRRAPLDPALGEKFSVREALASGVSSGRLTAHDLQIPFRGARTIGPRPVRTGDMYERQRAALRERCAAYAPVAPKGFAFSHATAASLYGLPLPRRLRAVTNLHVTVPVGVRPPRRQGIVSHAATFVAERAAGLPAVSPQLAWLQLASDLMVDELVVAGDALVSRKRPLCTLGDLRELVAASHRVRGIRQARAAMGDIRSGTDSPPETELRLCLVRRELPEPRVGFEVHDQDGFFVGTPDLAYPVERIAIEYQGPSHWESKSVFEDDIIRRELFRRAGWHVLLVTSRILRRPASLTAEVAALLAERALR